MAKKTASGTREPTTIRFPTEVLTQAREVRTEGESMNELVVHAVEKEVRRRAALGLHEEIVRAAARIKARTGVQPDSAPIIRGLREGKGRR